ncbi:MAG: hypothetical protein A2Y17_13245 [Clostridiales bacterium GWF2_38_85]|nr:MAG: hypothetical protein A2Y17_13245 [Clostridiales bacterium GWF2_38_85]
MKNRTIIGIFCIFLAVAVMFGISPIVNRMAAGKTTVYQVSKMVEQGKMIAKEDVTKVEIGSSGVKTGYIKDESQLVGKYAKSDIYPNINIYPEMISDKADSAEDVFRTLDGKKLAISVTIPSFATGLSGKLQNGDIVSVIVTNGAQSSIPAQLTYVKIITTTTKKGADNGNVPENKDGTTDLPSTATLLVNPEQAVLLASYEQNNKLHLALVYRGTPEQADKYVAEQQKVLESGAK